MLVMIMMMMTMRQGHIPHARSQICHRGSIPSADTLYSSPVLYKCICIYASAFTNMFPACTNMTQSMYKYDSSICTVVQI